ncbi:CpsD/CapB family tyrosine-protein kinase [Nitrosococcus watsonii]|uniref:Chromosome partitioning ATPase-like protein n=1 Tax=Nitrosococcus watsoni (strain C-113) TaxID=105559 RepID=D8KBF5_NITWC|nr:CpsD/CapB family tyrosine-protein kinase [Nitrosococcus watsonii]ADJ29602.1 chromosome partitioning ATPase-like protein [Nitrosococcus watsonii C-113]
MAKIYEALEQAEKEYNVGVLDDASPDAFIAREVEATLGGNARAGDEPYANLKASLFHRYPEEKLRVVMFMAPAPGAGVTTTVANFGAVLAQDANTKVLLVDANTKNFDLCNRFNVTHARDLPTVVEGMPPVTKVYWPGNLYLTSYGKQRREDRAMFSLQPFNRFLDIIREQFDYVLFDAPPAKDFSETFSFCSQVDGVVFVLEAGKTRHQVAIALKKKVEEAGGRILGVVLNRKKRYIPDFIYKRLF